MKYTNSIPIVISGAPRSGTSLLYNLFDQHRDINWLVSEGYFFEYLYDLTPKHSGLFVQFANTNVENFVVGLRDKQIIPPLHETFRQNKRLGSVVNLDYDIEWNEEVFVESLLSAEFDNVNDLWNELVNAMSIGLGIEVRKYSCLKSPDFGKSTCANIDQFPNSKSIVIIRDPIYSLDSLKRSRELRDEKLLTWPSLAFAVDDFRKMDERISKYHSDQLMVVRYEDLVSDIEQQMKQISSWIGIDFDECLLTPTMFGQSWPGFSSFEGTSGVDSAPANRPIQSLTREEVQIITDNLADFRQKYGYAS